MKVRFYSFNKAPNSTKQVSGTYTELDCELKSGTSIISPVFTLSESVYNVSWNYAYVPTWSRYYFIGDVTHQTGGRAVLSFSCDVLGTFKSEILTSTAYVMRSASSYDLFLRDELWTHDTSIHTAHQAFNMGFKDINSLTGTVAGGTVVVGIQSAPTSWQNVSPPDAGTMGTDMQFYCMSPYYYGLFLKSMYSSANAGQLYYDVINGVDSDDGISDDTTKRLAEMFFNPANYVKYVKWFPFDINTVGSSTDITDKVVVVGDSNIGTIDAVALDGFPTDPETSTSGTKIMIGGYKWCLGPSSTWDSHIYLLKTRSVTLTKDITPTQWKYEKWIDRASDWSTYQVYIPSIGNINLPAKYSGTTLSIQLIVDIITGESNLIIKDGNGEWITSGSGMCGVPMTLTSFDYSNLFSSLQNYATSSTSLSATQKASGQIAVAGLASIAGNGADMALKMKNHEEVSASGTGNAIAGAIASHAYVEQQLTNGKQALANAQSTVNHDAMNPNCTQIGAFGNKTKNIIAQNKMVFTCSKYQRYEDITARLGGKRNKIMSLSGLTGFTQLADPEIEISGTYAERKLVNDAFASGAFIE